MKEPRIVSEEEIVRFFGDLERQHKSRLRRIRLQGYFMQSLIIAVVLLFVIWPFFL